MTSPIGKHPANRMFTPVAGVPRSTKTTPTPVQEQTTASAKPSPYNPHLADLTQTNKLRGDVLQQAANNMSIYGELVGLVDIGLVKTGIGMSPASHQVVMDNLRQVHDGTMMESTAHLREAVTFSQDAFESFTHGEIKQGMVESAGALINGALGTALIAPEATVRKIQDWFEPSPKPPKG